MEPSDAKRLGGGIRLRIDQAHSPSNPAVVHAVKADSEEAVHATFARDPWSKTHLRVEAVELWILRLDGQRA